MTVVDAAPSEHQQPRWEIIAVAALTEREHSIQNQIALSKTTSATLRKQCTALRTELVAQRQIVAALRQFQVSGTNPRAILPVLMTAMNAEFTYEQRRLVEYMLTTSSASIVAPSTLMALKPLLQSLIANEKNRCARIRNTLMHDTTTRQTEHYLRILLTSELNSLKISRTRTYIDNQLQPHWAA